MGPVTGDTSPGNSWPPEVNAGGSYTVHIHFVNVFLVVYMSCSNRINKGYIPHQKDFTNICENVYRIHYHKGEKLYDSIVYAKLPQSKPIDISGLNRSNSA